MTERERALVRLSAVMAGGNRDRLSAVLDAAASAGAGAEAIEETLLQSYLFLGYPAALQALALWRERHPRPAGTRSEDPAMWPARGAEVCAQVYGGQYERLRRNVARLHPDLERWMVVEGYGKVLGRPGLELRVRELCTVALLVGQDAPQQLYSHLRGALNVGASEAEVAEVIELAGAEVGPDRLAAARDLWRTLLGRRVDTVAESATPGQEG